ncbi:hypothetical protein WALSEDRAFT_61390 [Wallemia mellicola CBS 633.66]|uniref:Uncharacterized protein n=1 Tax=Wallemia mellicola (strain ATCC MYA-4683 / CBS 633.66) TaxID=671144 RepID=I4Y6H1_WALMC|nr:hypothetical protein WALSEDRAFT_61390 [Wallemia mellicola CBS 633.66]EIM19563.1 hypothetical protein WALSEDRAFT_61390 [Wallemia mellicola CBS 633.66]|eukprot:XP_006960361.1 hypothetical protein WALSEDRAFT_61390 [Wallemia mellicola CBS 633.66]
MKVNKVDKKIKEITNTMTRNEGYITKMTSINERQKTIIRSQMLERRTQKSIIQNALRGINNVTEKEDN